MNETLIQTTMLHDVDSVSLKNTTQTASGNGCRTLTVRSGRVIVRICLFSENPKNLEVKLEG